MKTAVQKTAVSLGVTVAVMATGIARAQSLSAASIWPHKLVKKWSVSTGKTDAAPALEGDRIYTFGRNPDGYVETLQCLNVEDGKEIWTEAYHSGADAEGSVPPAHSGIRSSPVLANGKVTTCGLLGTLSCVDSATGKLLWRRNVTEEYPKLYVPQTPLVLDGLCIARPSGTDDNVVTAYDLAAPAEKWRWTGEAPSYSALTAMNLGIRFVIVQTDQKIVVLHATNGAVAWQSSYTPRSTDTFVGAPVVDGDVVIYFGESRGTTAVRFEQLGKDFASKELWSNAALSWQFNRPLIKDGLMYALGDNGHFICVNARTGKTLWMETAGGHGPYGAIADGGSVLFALTPDGQLTVLAPDDKAYTALASIKVSSKPTFAAPVVSGNNVFIQDQESLTLWTIE